ncbi:MAG: hypothetical protein RLZZ500_331 [Bacteroidota bacterium]|jgi:hypothetical protein
MNKSVIFLVVLALFSACKPQVKLDDLPKLNGYWEIQKVEMKDGDDKDYKVNPTVDYIEIKGKTGFRQKVMPQLDGTFRTNNLQEQITVKDDEGELFLHYKTPYGVWKEAVVELSDSILVVKNQSELTYHYKKFKPFSKK